MENLNGGDWFYQKMAQAADHHATFEKMKPNILFVKISVD
jgi:hypothetical protein